MIYLVCDVSFRRFGYRWCISTRKIIYLIDVLLVVFGPAGPNTTNSTAIATLRR